MGRFDGIPKGSVYLLPTAVQKTCKAGADDHNAFDAFVSTRLHFGQHLVGGHGQHGQIDGVGDRLQAGPRAHPLHRVDAGVDRVDGAGEAMGQKIVEQFSAYRATAPRRADHGDRPRPQDVLD